MQPEPHDHQLFRVFSARNEMVPEFWAPEGFVKITFQTCFGGRPFFASHDAHVKNGWG